MINEKGSDLIIAVDVTSSIIDIGAYSRTKDKSCYINIEPYCADVKFNSVLNYKKSFVMQGGIEYIQGTILPSKQNSLALENISIVSKVAAAVAIVHQKLDLSPHFKLSLLLIVSFEECIFIREQLNSDLMSTLKFIETSSGTIESFIEDIEIKSKGVGLDYILEKYKNER